MLEQREHVGPDLTLGQLLHQWRQTTTLAPSTAANYDRYESLIPPHLLTVRARDIDPSTLDLLYRRLLEQGTSVHAVLGIHGILSAAYSQGSKWWDMRNPTRRATPPVRPKATRNTRGLREFDPAELLAAAPDLVHKVWLCIHLTTGARRSEVLALRWSDFDLERGIVVIAEALDPITKDRKETKTGDKRRLPLDPTTVELVRQWHTAAVERAKDASAILPVDSYVFSDKVDCSKPWTPDAASKRYQRLVGRAGIRGVTLHGLRHAMGSLLIAQGTDSKTVQARLGHANWATTMNTYSHSLPITELEAANAIGSLIHKSG